VEGKKHLDRLKELAVSVPDLTRLAIEGPPGSIIYTTPEGPVTGWNIMNIPEIAIQRLYLPKGYTFPGHQHEEHEWVITYSGHWAIIFDDGERVEMKTGDGAHIAPHRSHHAKGIEDTWLIGVTIPSSRGYPGNDKRENE